jgi:hypothetical protein
MILFFPSRGWILLFWLAQAKSSLIMGDNFYYSGQHVWETTYGETFKEVSRVWGRLGQLRGRVYNTTFITLPNLAVVHSLGPLVNPLEILDS